MKRLYFIAFFILLSACDQQKQQAVESTPAETPAAVTAPIAAVVNGEVIMESELEQLALDMFGEYQASFMDEVARQRLLDSMVSTVALAQKSFTELSAEERAKIENKTKRYRENLLVSQYVRSNVTPSPVTEAMIQEHYNKNLPLYGASSIRKYQLVTTRQALAVDQRTAFLRQLAEMKSETSLQRIHEKFKSSGFQTSYQSGVAEPGLLSKKLQQIIDSQTAGKLSDVHFIDDIPYLVLVDEVLQKKAKPLSQVRNDIRKTLAMAQLKEAVKSLSESVRKQAAVTIH
jgi:hypothetical protein